MTIEAQRLKDLHTGKRVLPEELMQALGVSKLQCCAYTTCFEWCEEEYCAKHRESHIVNYTNVQEDKK